MSVGHTKNASTAAVPRSTAIGAVACALVFITVFVFIVAVWPLYGVKSAADVADPAKILPAVADHPILTLFNALDVPLAVLLLLVARGLSAYSSARSPSALARGTALVAAGCFFAVGALRLVGYAQLASLYGRDAAAATRGYATFYLVQDTLDGAAIFTLGCWLVMTNWVCLKSDRLPVALTRAGLAAGAASLAGSTVHAVQPAAVVLVLIWFGWLGVALLRASEPWDIRHGSPRLSGEKSSCRRRRTRLSFEQLSRRCRTRET
jgi:Domain of unknown function (DUF4386)